MFSCNVVLRWAQLFSFLICLQDVKVSRIAIYRYELRRMNCSLNWSSMRLWRVALWLSRDKNNDKLQLVFLKTMRVFGLGDCFVVLLLATTHFRKIGHAQQIRRCFSFS